MSKPIVKIHNAQTDEIIEREMTDDEFVDYQQAIVDSDAARLKVEAAKIARQSALDKLAALGLTADEVAALIP